MEKHIGEWDDIYRNARKSEKLRFETNERDEGELERTGQPICIYEIYNGAGGWPFLHHGSLYRGLSLVSSSLLGCCILTWSMGLWAFLHNGWSKYSAHFNLI